MWVWLADVYVCTCVYSYGMLASVSTVVKGDMGEHLEVIVRRMMETLTSEEGVKVRQ